ncbi:MAG: radical SAM protein [Rikenellaceae bacterium]
MTALFNNIIFGPIHSRRLGISLGVNLLPTHSKLCNFDCIYCECGWNGDNRSAGAQFNSREDVNAMLEQTLQKMSAEGQLPDVITFAGNGEPTLHPKFECIIEDTIILRDKYAPKAKVSVLTNAATLHREDVVRALKRVDNNILKLDSAFDVTARLMNNPASSSYSIAKVVEQMMTFGGDLIVQTMFLRGSYNGQHIDNTTPEEVSAWLALIAKISPRQVMVYSIDRDTPCHTIEKVSREDMLAIASQVERLGIRCSVA